jgi:hypothetical protein
MPKKFVRLPEDVFPVPAVEPVVVKAPVVEKAPKEPVDAALNLSQHRVLVSLAKDIQDLTAAGPGKVTQPLLDALHAKAQRLVNAK